MPRNSFPAEPTVVWVPSPPASGSQSMDRYWRELHRLGKQAPHFRSFLKEPPERSERAGRLRRAWQRYVAYPLRALLAGRATIFHLLDHSHAHLLPYLRNKGRLVVTVHDLIPLRDATGLTPAQVARFRRGVLEMRAADLILTDSDFTAGDVRALLGAACPPIKTLLLGVDAARFAAPATVVPPWLAGLPSGVPVCLCVGSELARKNMQILPELLGAVLGEVPAVIMLKLGSEFDADTRARLQKLEPRLRIQEISSASEDELVAAYQRADVLLFPSLLEGFGLPVLEALAAGTPVVASHSSSIPEVGGPDACLYFDPHDPAAGARQVLRILQDAPLRAALIERGQARARELSWSAHFASLQAIYRELEPATESESLFKRRFRLALRPVVVGLARVLGSPVRDVETGAILGRALLVPWRGSIYVIGLEDPVRAVFLAQQRITYWQQQIGFAAPEKPDFPHERDP